MKSEFELIRWLRSRGQSAAPNLVKGIGDDCAIITPTVGCDWLISCDLLVEDVHFKLSYTPPRALGHKTLAVSLSDIAAMGGRPQFCTLSLAIPPHLSVSFLEDFFTGLLTLAQDHQVTLIGGDTSASPDKLVIDLMILGESDSGRAIRRDGARPGDLIYVTGELGAAAAGLKLLERGYQVVTEQPNEIEQLMNAAVAAQLEPAPRVSLGQALAAQQLASALIDLSDGLSSDLNHICRESGVGAVVWADKLPISPATKVVRGNVLELALNGGEDYELLFTSNPAHQTRLAAVPFAVPLTCIGEITATQEVFLAAGDQHQPLLPNGYEHYKGLAS